jgi:hypothetical protein
MGMAMPKEARLPHRDAFGTKPGSNPETSSGQAKQELDTEAEEVG